MTGRRAKSGTATNGAAAAGPVPRTLSNATIQSGNGDKLTLAQLCDELQISRSTFYDWRAKGRAPKCIKLPNGDLRVRRCDLELWLTTCEESRVG